MCARLLFLVAAVLFGCVSAADPDCLSVLRDAGASEQFGSNVGHSVHSLTVQDLKAFNPNVTENNRVPTIDFDLRSDHAIRLNAPSAEPSPFVSDGLQAIDRVLMHMDDPNYDVKDFSILERMVHVFHMKEVWHMAKSRYEELVRNPPSSAACHCALDIENNNIMKALRFTALAMREPELVYGMNKTSYYVQYQVTYSFGTNTAVDAQGPLVPDSVLLKESDSMPELTDSSSWAKWKSILTSMKPSMHTDVGLFLYCALQPQG